jgi:murein DD-endopeptidase MepM/ murein hydrolase activator NlpD
VPEQVRSTNVYVDGTTNGICPIGCGCSGVVHTPEAYNHTGSTGGWKYGPSGPWNSYISAQNDLTIVGVPGVIYMFTFQGEIICSIAGTLFNSGSGSTPVAGFTPSTHTYTTNPLSKACRISQFFDNVVNGKVHHAEDVVYDAGNGKGTQLPLGAPVYASEGGTVVSTLSGTGPAPQPYPTCRGTGALVNYVKIKGTDNYFTVYAHVTPIVKTGATVTAGQQIGTADNSGCQNVPHIHMARKDPSGTPKNFHIPCVNQDPTTNFADGLAYDDVPDNI